MQGREAGWINYLCEGQGTIGPFVWMEGHFLSQVNISLLTSFSSSNHKLACDYETIHLVNGWINSNTPTPNSARANLRHLRILEQVAIVLARWSQQLHQSLFRQCRSPYHHQTKGEEGEREKEKRERERNTGWYLQNHRLTFLYITMELASTSIPSITSLTFVIANGMGSSIVSTAAL